MTELTVRRLLIDLEAPVARHWNGGDAFRTAFFNALSMSFPRGEQFFIDALRDGVKTLPESARQRLAPELRGFVGQEATHRRIHALFNAQIEKHGLQNRWEARIERRLRQLERLPPAMAVKAAVAATAATEHFTAIFADWLLREPALLAGTEARLQTLWIWHACEELEHRSTALEVYRAMGGAERMRRHLMRFVTVHFLCDLALQTTRNLQRDGTLWRWHTWRSGWATVFGARGMLRQLWKPWRHYFGASFHPAGPGTASDAPARQWLAEHAAQFRVIEQAAAEAGA